MDGVFVAAELFEEFCGVLMSREAVEDVDCTNIGWAWAEGFVDVPGLFGEGVRVFDEIWEGFRSGSDSGFLLELVQVGDQAGWGWVDGMGFLRILFMNMVFGFG